MKLFSVGQITAACFFGSPALAGSLYGINEMRMGRRDRAAWVAGAGLAVTALVYVYVFLAHPIAMLTIPLHVALTVVTEKLAERHHGPELKARLAEGAQVRSNKSLFVMWLAEVVLVWSIVLPIQRRRFNREHPSVEVGQSRIYYRPPATPAQAEQVGRFFESDFRDGLAGFHLQLDRTAAGYALSFGHARVPFDERQIKLMSDLVSSRVFQGRPVEPRLCHDNDFRECDTIY